MHGDSGSGEILNEYFALIITKEKDMSDCEIRDVYVDILRHIGMKKEEVLDVLKNIQVDVTGLIGSIPGY